MILTPLEFGIGFLSTVLVCVSVVIGVRITLKYRENKDKTFLFFGLTWIFLVEPWYPSMISFLMALVINSTLSLEIYLFLGLFFIPVGLFTGITAFSELLFKERQKQLQGIMILMGILFDGLFLYFLLTDPFILGMPYSAVDIEYSLLTQVFLLVNGPICVVCGGLFARETLRSDSADVRLKGKLLVVAFMSFAVGGLMEVITLMELLTAVARVFTIIGAFFFYSGFMLPKWMKELFLKH